MKKIISLLLSAIILTSFLGAIPVEAASSSVNEYGTIIKLKGETNKSKNKSVLKKINEERKSANLEALTMDKTLTKYAYERATMLAVSYSEEMPTQESGAYMPFRVVIARGKEYTKLVNAVKKSAYIKASDINSCGIANLKIGTETFWAALFSYELNAKSVTDYSSETKSYSKAIAYDTKYIKLAPSYTRFTKSAKLKEKAKITDRALYIRNYNTKVKNYMQIKNYSGTSPIEYTSTNPDAATVTSGGKVTARHASIYRTRSEYTPKKGDFILFRWRGAKTTASHVGIVYRVSGNRLYTIEGNANGTSYSNSTVTTKMYSDFKYNSEIIGFMDMSVLTTRAQAHELADLARNQLGKKGSNYYNHTKAWIEGPTQWCSIFCAWLMEQKGIDPASVSWYASCSSWINAANEHATTNIRARLLGTSKYYTYKVSVTR